MQKNYKHLFFDLDRTLWDFERNSEVVLNQLFRDFQLQQIFGSYVLFKARYKYHNQRLWMAYHQNRINKETLMVRRFYLSLKEAGCDDMDMAHEMGEDYLELSALQTHTFPNTHKTLAYLHNKGYKMHIITNGFNRVQSKKLANCKLDTYITNLITSEDAGHTKPHKAIFEYALKMAGAKSGESLMVGDDLKTDIQGACNAGIDQVYFNPLRHESQEGVISEISDLSELRQIL